MSPTISLLKLMRLHELGRLEIILLILLRRLGKSLCFTSRLVHTPTTHLHPYTRLFDYLKSHVNLQIDLHIFNHFNDIKSLPFNDNLTLLFIDTNGSEYWYLKTLLEYNTTNTPNIIITPFSYIAGVHKSISVPYMKDYPDINYRGASIRALGTLLCKHGYVYAGVSKHCTHCIFIHKLRLRDIVLFSLKNNIPTIESSLDDITSQPIVQYGINNRWTLVENKLWITIK